MIAGHKRATDAATDSAAHGQDAGGVAGLQRRSPRCQQSRNGVATLWLLLLLPALLVLLCFVVEIGHLWLARAELETALEAAALAAVQEWGNNSGGSTLVPRQVGVAYAGANSVGGSPLVITANHNPANAPNENNDCAGDLVFGAITATAPNVIFDAGVAPGCGGGGSVMLDATGQGNLGTDNAWGIAFRNTVDTPPGLRIDKVIIDLRAGGGAGFFTAAPVLSDNVPQHKVRDGSGNDQPDIVGFPQPASQIIFTNNTGQLIIDFMADSFGIDQGFEPGDRFRFGALVDDVSQGSGDNDGDGIGRDGVGVTIVFSLGGVPLPPVSATFADNMESSNDCIDPAQIDPNPLSSSLIVNPNGVPDLPCPEGSSPGNNGQSFAQVAGGGGDIFAVRAQATIDVDSICDNLFDCILGPTTVSAQTTAIFDCDGGLPRLIRVDQFICP